MDRPLAAAAGRGQGPIARVPFTFTASTNLFLHVVRRRIATADPSAANLLAPRRPPKRWWGFAGCLAAELQGVEQDLVAELSRVEQDRAPFPRTLQVFTS